MNPLKKFIQNILHIRLFVSFGIDKYFMHILYTFFLAGLIIWLSLMIDSTLTKVQQGKKTIHDLEIMYSGMVFNLASAQRRSTVEANLESLGSKVTEPQEPATVIGK